MIYGFDQPHRVGSVCRFPCVQCNDAPGRPELSEHIGSHGPIDVTQPLLIVREAMYAEYLEFCREARSPLPPVSPDVPMFYYEVQTD